MGRSWIAFYMGDYQRDTNRLTTLEHGAYFLLLQECWTHGRIPLDPADRAAIVKLPLKEWLKIAPRVNPYFDEEGRNKRATKEIEKAEIIRTKRAIAGQRGGFASGITKAKQAGSKMIANAMQMDQQNTKPSVPNHNKIDKTSTDRVERGEGLANGSPRIAPSPQLLASLGRPR